MQAGDIQTLTRLRFVLNHGKQKAFVHSSTKSFECLLDSSNTTKHAVMRTDILLLIKYFICEQISQTGSHRSSGKLKSCLKLLHFGLYCNLIINSLIFTCIKISASKSKPVDGEKQWKTGNELLSPLALGFYLQLNQNCFRFKC